MANCIMDLINKIKGNILLIFFVFIAIFPKINIINIPGTYVGIRFEDILALCYAIYVFYGYLKYGKNRYGDKIYRISCIFTIYFISCFISTIYGSVKNYISLYMGLFYLFRKLEYFVLVFVGYDFINKTLNKKEGKNKFLSAINFLVVIHFFICLLQNLGCIGSFDRGGYVEWLVQHRVCSTFNGAYEMTAVLLLFSSIYCYKLFKNKESVFSNSIYLLMIGFMIFVSESRTSLVIFAFLIILMAVIYNVKHIKQIVHSRKFMIIAFIFIIFILIMIPKLKNSRLADVNIFEMIEATKYAFENKSFERYVEKGDWYRPEDFYMDDEGKLIMAVECDPSYFMRISHWAQLLDGLGESPILGAGPSISQTAADGNYVRIISESGILGFLLWVFWQIYIFKSLNKNNEFNVGTKFALITLLLGAIFIDVFEASKVMMTFYYILGVTLALNEKEKNQTMDKIKNVVVINDFNYIEGGASKVAIKTADLLKEKIENVYYFCAVSKEQDKIDGVKYVTTNQTEALKTKNKLVGMINGIYNFKAKRELKRLLKTLDVNETVIHIHGWTKALSSSVFDIAFFMGFKVVLTTHDYFTACPNGGYFNYNQNRICEFKPQSLKCVKCNCDSRNYIFKIYRLIRQFVQNQIVQVNKKIEYVVGISDKNIQVLKNTLNKDVKIRKILNPIDIEKIDERVKVENNDTYLFIGRAAKEKGIDIFCKEISNLNLHGIVVGDGPELNRLKGEYKNIEFVGWKNKSEINEYLAKARMFIFPSLWYEGAPLTPLEVMSYGIPCILSNCSAATEYIKNENGEIFDPYKNNDLEEKINKVNNNIKKYSENSYKYCSEFINKNYIDELLEFMRGVK